MDEVKRIQQIIVENLAQNYDFIRAENIEMRGVYPNQFQEVGLLWRRFTLADVQGWTQLDESNDHAILKAFDDLSSKRKLKIFRCEIPRGMHHDNIALMAEIGKSLREVTANYGMKTLKTVFYWQQPLSKREYLKGDRTITNVSARVGAIRKKRDKFFQQRFGTINFELEKQLIHENILADAQVGNAVLRIAKAVEEKKGKEGNV